MFYISPEIVENVIMCKKIINDKLLYITYADFKRCVINKKVFTNILNIGNKYKICVALKGNIGKDKLIYICIYIAILISDIDIINKINNINEGIRELDIALDLGKDIYAIPGDIFKYQNYLANFAIKQGAIPICSMHDMKYILAEKKFNLL